MSRRTLDRIATIVAPVTLIRFIKAHWGQIAATDFFTVEVWSPKGLVTHYVS